MCSFGRVDRRPGGRGWGPGGGRPGPARSRTGPGGVAEGGGGRAGTVVRQGAPLGPPSCEGGRATGTHFHFARRYNGEWTAAAGSLPIELDGWVAYYGEKPYEGTLGRGSKVVEACTCSRQANRIIYELK